MTRDIGLCFGNHTLVPCYRVAARIVLTAASASPNAPPVVSAVATSALSAEVAGPAAVSIAGTMCISSLITLDYEKTDYA